MRGLALRDQVVASPQLAKLFLQPNNHLLPSLNHKAMPTPLTNTYCLPLLKRTQAEIVSSIELHVSRYRYFEVWLDYLSDIDPNFAASLVARFPGRLIMVFRRQNFETPAIDPTLRQRIIESLASKEVLIDFDTSHQVAEIEMIRREGLTVSTILSYHNYSATPGDEELRAIAARAQDFGAHITKLSTFCVTQRDALRLLSLLLDLRQAGRRCIVLGMGEHGVVTRIFGLRWGNELSFTPLEVAQGSAPGQIPLDKLDSIMQALN
jgi:3-dehydroquinate dehydratase type I